MHYRKITGSIFLVLVTFNIMYGQDPYWEIDIHLTGMALSERRNISAKGLYEEGDYVIKESFDDYSPAGKENEVHLKASALSIYGFRKVSIRIFCKTDSMTLNMVTDSTFFDLKVNNNLETPRYRTNQIHNPLWYTMFHLDVPFQPGVFTPQLVFDKDEHIIRIDSTYRWK